MHSIAPLSLFAIHRVTCNNIFRGSTLGWGVTEMRLSVTFFSSIKLLMTDVCRDRFNRIISTGTT